MRWHRMNYGLEKPKLSFLKIFGAVTLMWKVLPDKLEPKADKIHLHRTPQNSWVYLLIQIRKQKWLFPETGPFSRKSFSWKNWVGGWWRLDEVIEPSLQLVCSREHEVVPVAPTPMKWKLMIVIMKLQIKSLPNLVGWQGCVVLQSGTWSCLGSHVARQQWTYELWRSDGGPGFR